MECDGDDVNFDQSAHKKSIKFGKKCANNGEGEAISGKGYEREKRKHGEKGTKR